MSRSAHRAGRRGGRPETSDGDVVDAREKSIWQYLGLALSGALLILIVALAAAVIVVPKVAGAVPLTVLTSSMKPGLPPGTLIIVRDVDPDTLVVGDVATYQIESGKPGVITHRITSIATTSNGEREFVFRGDNNSEADLAAVVPEQIQGKLWYSIPLLGYVNNAVNGANKSWIIPVAAGLLFAYAAYSVISGTAAAVRRRRRASAQEARNSLIDDPETSTRSPGR